MLLQVLSREITYNLFFLLKHKPGGAVVKNLLADAGDARDTGFDPGGGKIP